MKTHFLGAPFSLHIFLNLGSVDVSECAKQDGPDSWQLCQHGHSQKQRYKAVLNPSGILSNSLCVLWSFQVGLAVNPSLSTAPQHGNTYTYIYIYTNTNMKMKSVIPKNIFSSLLGLFSTSSLDQNWTFQLD